MNFSQKIQFRSQKSSSGADKKKENWNKITRSAGKKNKVESAQGERRTAAAQFSLREPLLFPRPLAHNDIHFATMQGSERGENLKS